MEYTEGFTPGDFPGNIGDLLIQPNDIRLLLPEKATKLLAENDSLRISFFEKVKKVALTTIARVGTFVVVGLGPPLTVATLLANRYYVVEAGSVNWAQMGADAIKFMTTTQWGVGLSVGAVLLLVAALKNQAVQNAISYIYSKALLGLTNAVGDSVSSSYEAEFKEREEKIRANRLYIIQSITRIYESLSTELLKMLDDCQTDVELKDLKNKCSKLKTALNHANTVYVRNKQLALSLSEVDQITESLETTLNTIKGASLASKHHFIPKK